MAVGMSDRAYVSDARDNMRVVYTVTIFTVCVCERERDV